MNPLVSIITVCFNSEKTIAKTIESVLNQSYDNIEYIIIDGKSSDNTLEVVKKFEDAFQKKEIVLTVISESDAGIYDAMNKGINLSSGEIIGIINSDDWYETDAVSQMIEVYNKNRFDVFYADLRIHKPSGLLIKHAKNKKFVSTRHWNHPTTFVTKEIYREFKYSLDRGIYADWDFILRLRKNRKKIVVLNKIIANFEFGGISSKKSILHTINRIKLRYSIYRNNGYSRFYIFDCILVEFAKYLAA